MEWAKGWGAPETLLSTFKEQQVDGVALSLLGAKDLKELVPLMGPRKKLEHHLIELRAGKEDAGASEDANDAGELSLQDVSCTCYLGPNTTLGGGGPLFTGKLLPRICLVTYVGTNRRNRGWGGDDDAPRLPPGTPMIMLEMKNVRCTSLSTGGSGGEDRLTANMSWSGDSLTYHTIGNQDFNGLLPEMRARWMGGVFPDEKLQVGISVTGGKGVTPQTIEWGDHVSWSRKTHSLFPLVFKKTVKELLLCHKREPLNKLPRDVIIQVISVLSWSYRTNPFEECPFPEKIEPEEEEEKKKDGNGDDE